MKRSKKIIAAVLAAVASCAAIWMFFYIRDHNTRELRRLVSELEDIAAKRPGRSNALALLDAASPERIFAQQVTVRSDRPAIDRTFEVKELAQLLVTMKKSCRSMQLDFSIESIAADGGQAEISGDALFTGDSGKGSFREARMVVLQCRKSSGRWKICGVVISRLIAK